MRFILITLAFLWSGLAHADELRPALPALYRVIGVTIDDVLNIRAAPDASASTVGEFASDAKDIEVTALSLSGSWARVNTGENTGWVAFRYLARQPMVIGFAGLPDSLSCFGAEPFWNLRLTAEGLQLNRPDGSRTFPMSVIGTSAPVSLGITGFHFTWMADDVHVRAWILPGQCSDGMSDAIYALHYVDTYLGHHGCCHL
ncbi:SH3 domain-containing protein [Loktanella agnita]|uniref:SH3 domain-containing protein n=1 Tax=Loktanella agnita TaxID=287097 RepID=UPI0039885ADD